MEKAITAALKSYYIEVFPTATGEDADDLETELILSLKPKLNIQKMGG